MSLLTLLALYISFRLKQVICDFVLQTKWMAMYKGLPGWDGYRHLGKHAGVHGIGTLGIMLVFAPSLWWLGIVDFIVHGLIDRIKAVLTARLKLEPADSGFWWAIGIDQEMHNFTHLAYILFLIYMAGGLVTA